MFKMLGRQIQWELTNTKIIEKLDALIEEWLNKVDAISESGTIKSWIVDYVVVSRFSLSNFMIFHKVLFKIGQIDVTLFTKNGSK